MRFRQDVSVALYYQKLTYINFCSLITLLSYKRYKLFEKHKQLQCQNHSTYGTVESYIYCWFGSDDQLKQSFFIGFVKSISSKGFCLVSLGILFMARAPRKHNNAKNKNGLFGYRLYNGYIKNGIKVAPTRPKNEFTANPIERTEVEYDSEVKGQSIWNIAFISIFVKNKVVEFKNHMVIRQKTPEPTQKNIKEVFLPHPFLSISVQVSSRVGIQPKVIQKYCINPFSLTFKMKGTMNISPKKIILMKNQLADNKVTRFLQGASNFNGFYVYYFVLNTVNDHFIIYSFQIFESYYPLQSFQLIVQFMTFHVYSWFFLSRRYLNDSFTLKQTRKTEIRLSTAELSIYCEIYFSSPSINIKARPTPPNFPIEFVKLIISSVLPLNFIGINSVIITVATANVDPNPIPYNKRHRHIHKYEMSNAKNKELINCIKVPKTNAFFLPCLFDCIPDINAPTPTPIQKAEVRKDTQLSFKPSYSLRIGVSKETKILICILVIA